MLSIFLIAAGSFFSEVATSLGKNEVARRNETIYSFGFLSISVSTLVFLLIALVRGTFVFSSASLPTLVLHAAFSIIQSYVSIKAVTIADRSTYGFLRVFTIPVLLVVDLVLAYSLPVHQIMGASILTLSVLFLLLNHGLRTKGVVWVLLSAINAVITLSLFKYNITRFNSVEVEQGIVNVVLLLYFAIMVWRNNGINPLMLLTRPLMLAQSCSQALAGVLVSFGYLFVPASVATSVERAASVFFSVLAGNRQFHEKRLAQKLIAFALLAIGLVVLAGLPS